MEVLLAKRDLLKMVGRMQGVAEKKGTMPVLANVLLAVDGAGGLRLSATDLYLSLTGRIEADVGKAGSVAVSAKDLFERVKMMPEGPIALTVGDNSSTTLKAKGSARRYTVRGMRGDDFPPMPRPSEDAPTLALSVPVLAKLIERSSFAVSTDETRPHLNCALFEWEGETVRMVGTDGHRLAKTEARVAGRHASSTMMIPLKAIGELRRLCEEMGAQPIDGEQREILITQSGSSAFFAGSGVVFSVKLVDAQFPPYNQVIPTSAPHIVRAPRAAFIDAVKAIALAANETTGGVTLRITKGSMRIHGESPDKGDGEDEIPVEYAGPALKTGFAPKYLLDVLSVIDTDEVVLEMGGELDPLIVRPGTEDESSNMLTVIMPMRVG